ncbi:MAG: alpha/beta hydrolase [Planctomycetaceae bacterium]
MVSLPRFHRDDAATCSMHWMPHPLESISLHFLRCAAEVRCIGSTSIRSAAVRSCWSGVLIFARKDLMTSRQMLSMAATMFWSTLFLALALGTSQRVAGEEYVAPAYAGPPFTNRSLTQTTEVSSLQSVPPRADDYGPSATGPNLDRFPLDGPVAQGPMLPTETPGASVLDQPQEFPTQNPQLFLGPTGQSPSMAPVPIAVDGVPFGEGAVVSDVPWIGTAEQPHYWFASSRESTQNVRDGVGGLTYFERLPDGSLCRTSLAGMLSQFQPGVPVLVFCHGSFVDFASTLQESHAAYRWMRRACPNLPLHIVFFTWPSETECTLLTPVLGAARGKQAEYNGLHLAQFLRCLPDEHPVTLFGHSHGTRVIFSALEIAAGGTIQGMELRGGVGQKRLRAIVTASAIDHQWLNVGQRYGRALCRAEGVLNLRNSEDCVLAIYPLNRPFAGRAFGRIGQTRTDERRQPCACKVTDYDVGDLIGRGHVWPSYFSTPQIASLTSDWVYYPDVNPGLMRAASPTPWPVSR